MFPGLPRRTGLACVIVIAILAQPLFAAELVLFDGSLGTLPSAQGWPFLVDPPFGHSVTQTVNGSATTFNSASPITDRGGYFSRDPVFGLLFHPDMPTIDRAAGFRVRFDVQIMAENHVTGPSGDDNADGLEDRSGFSVIVISQDLEGLELAFWEDRIWAQEDDALSAEDLFTQAEGVAFDTTSHRMRYDLEVSGNTYSLYADQGATPILEGPLRNYTNFSGSLDPYETASFLFLGDDTTRGESLVEWAHVSITTFEWLAGDVDFDQDVDFDDIDDFVLGLNDPAAYEQLFGLPPSRKGDTDEDGDLDFDDIASFVDILNGAAPRASHFALPEPRYEEFLFMSAAALSCAWRQGRRQRAQGPGASFQSVPKRVG
jgi:hypothetical protein